MSVYQKARPPTGLFGGTRPLGANPLRHWGPPRVKVSKTEMGAWGVPYGPLRTGDKRPNAPEILEQIRLHVVW